MPSKYAAKLDWYGDEIERNMDTAVMNALEGVGRNAEQVAKDTVHVVTGNLRESIYHEVLPGLLILGAGEEYAIYEEARHPYLWPALEAVQGTVPGAIKTEFGGKG